MRLAGSRGGGQVGVPSPPMPVGRGRAVPCVCGVSPSGDPASPARGRSLVFVTWQWCCGRKLGEFFIIIIFLFISYRGCLFSFWKAEVVGQAGGQAGLLRGRCPGCPGVGPVLGPSPERRWGDKVRECSPLNLSFVCHR